MGALWRKQVPPSRNATGRFTSEAAGDGWFLSVVKDRIKEQIQNATLNQSYQNKRGGGHARAVDRQTIPVF